MKGHFYYEIQILMWVIMLQHADHNNKIFKQDPPRKKGSIRIGPLYIWKDSAWLTHGFGLKIWPFLMPILRYRNAYKAFRRLYKLGFYISYTQSEHNMLDIYRFNYNGKRIKDWPEITQGKQDKGLYVTTGGLTERWME